MRIAIWHNLPSGGGKRALYYHVKGLLERGHYLESWCPPTADQNYLPLSSLIKENVVPLDEPTIRTNSVSRALSAYRQTVAQINAIDVHSQRCAEEINQGDFDILFANACMFFHAPTIGRYINIPTALYLGEPYRDFYEARPRLPWLALASPSKPWYISRSYLKSFLSNLVQVQGIRIKAREELKNAESFDLILVNSLFSRESVLRSYGLESSVCYLGIDSNLFTSLNMPRKDIVIGLGTIYSGKGLARAIRAIATIEKTQRPTLLWIGNGVDPYYQQKIESLAQSLEVDFIPKVRVSDQELVSLLNQASVMIYTSCLEPFGLAPLEANACETPVVAIAEGGVRESIVDGVNGFLINGDDSVAIGKAVSTLLQNQSLARQMGQRARERVLEHWSLESAIDRLEKLLLSLMNRIETKQQKTFL